MISTKTIREYGCYITALFFLYVLVGQIIQSRLELNEFVKVEGVVENTKVVRTGSRGNSRELRIYLQNSSEYFRIMDVYNYQKFQERIQPDVNVVIYVRPPWVVPLGMGYKNDVFHLVVNGKVLFDISKKKWHDKGIAIAALIVTPVMIFVGQLIRRKGKR